MTEANPIFDFSDADLASAFRRSLRSVAIIAVIAFPLVWIASGWQSGLLLLVGALISATGIWEARRLVGLVNAKLDQQKTPRSAGFVVAMFFLRLLLAGALLYVSLRCLHGSVYALIAGLLLAVVALSIEALRLLKN